MKTARPLTADLIRATGKPRASASSELTDFLATLADGVVAAFAEFTQAPVRVEPDGLSISAREIPVPEGVSVKLDSARGILTPVVTADRALVMALTEAAFGGAGTEIPYDGADRPFSKTERRLRDTLFSAVAAKLPEVLELCFAIPFRRIEDEARKPRTREAETQSFIAGRLLVYVFGYSGEVTILLPEEEFIQMTAAVHGTGTSQAPGSRDRSSFLQSLQGAEVQIAAMLPAELMPLAEVATLRRGQLLKLRADVNTPLMVTADEALLRHARMAQGSDRVTIEITG